MLSFPKNCRLCCPYYLPLSIAFIIQAYNPWSMHLEILLKSQHTQAPHFCFCGWCVYTCWWVSISMTWSVGQVFNKKQSPIQTLQHARSFFLQPSKENTVEFIFKERKRDRGRQLGQSISRSCRLSVSTCWLAWCHLVALLIPVCSLNQGMGTSIDPTIMSLCLPLQEELH